MRRHAPVFSKNRGTTREPELFDKLNYLLTPRLGGAVKSHSDDVQETVFGPGNHLWRNIGVAKIDGVVGELSCRAFGHSIPSNKARNSPPLLIETPNPPARAAPQHRESEPAQKPRRSQSFRDGQRVLYRCFASRLSSPATDRLWSQRDRARKSRRSDRL